MICLKKRNPYKTAGTACNSKAKFKSSIVFHLLRKRCYRAALCAYEIPQFCVCLGQANHWLIRAKTCRYFFTCYLNNIGHNAFLCQKILSQHLLYLQIINVCQIREQIFDTASCERRRGHIPGVIIPCHVGSLGSESSHKVELALRDHFSNYQEKICPKAFKNETWPTLQLHSNGRPAQKQGMTFKSEIIK